MNYWNIITLTALMTVSALYADTASAQSYMNNNWEETLDRLSHPGTLSAEPQEWENGIVSDTTLAEMYNVPQEFVYCPNELSVWASGGLSVLNYQPAFGSRDNHFGGTLGIGYTRCFSEHWGVLLGAELALYKSGFSQNKLHDNYDATDSDPYAPQKINFRYRVDNYEENHQLWNLNIPLMMQYQTKEQGNYRFFAAAGFKLGIPLSGKYESKNATIDSKGYYYDWNQTLNEPASLGYGVFGNQSAKGKLDAGLSCIASLEAGIKWELPAGINLYTGLYADYGLNDVIKGKHNGKFVVYDSYDNEDFTVINSVLASQYTTARKTVSFTDKVSPLSFGVKLRLGFPSGCPFRKKQTAEKIPLDCLPCVSCTEIARQSAETAQKAIEVLHEWAETVREPEIVNRQEAATNPENPGVTPEIPETNGFNVLQIGNINYGLNITTLTPEQEKELDKYVAVLQQNPSAKVILTGHACNCGSYSSNMRIGQQRADAAKEYILRQGIHPSRILAFSKGDTAPLYPNNTGAEKEKNRRLEIRIIK